MKKIIEYKNGNCLVQLFDDGTKIRECIGEPKPEFPESADVKLTDYCDAGCLWCHESSTKHGKHADFDIIKRYISDLPAGVELAIGGGDPLSYPELIPALEFFKSKNLISNITVNAVHLQQNKDLINKLFNEKLIYAMGISYNQNYIAEISEYIGKEVIIHMIAGYDSVFDYLNMFKIGFRNILVLGYKNFGRGVKYKNRFDKKIESNLDTWREFLKYNMRRLRVIFDNLAIEQLDIKNLLSERECELLYMGEEGEFTFYVDFVKQEYAKSSTSVDRFKLEGNLVDCFKKINVKDKSLNGEKK